MDMLIFLLAIPLIGAVLTLLMGNERAKYAKFVALAFSAATLVIAVALLFMQDDYATMGMNEVWIKTDFFQFNFKLALDGLSILMVFLTALLVFVVGLFSYEENDRPNYYHTLLLLMELGLMGVYLSADYFLFYIMWEVTLIPMYFMISWYGGPRRHYSAIKFFIYTHVASLVMLLGIFIMVFTAGGNFDFAAVTDYMSTNTDKWFQTAVFGLLFFGFIVKMPIVPFHTWLPDAHVEAPTGGSVLLAGVMLKMGSYGIIRICLENFKIGAVEWQWVMIILGIISMIYGAYACIGQTDLKKMVAYSSISHMGMVLLGIGCLSEIGIEFAVFQMFAHGLITAILFMVCGLAGHNIGTREIPLLGGLATKMPKWAFFMMFGFMASLGLPGLVGFVAEFGILYAFWEFIANTPQMWMLVFGMLSMMLTAGYYLWAMQRTLFGDLTTKIDFEHGVHGGPVHDISKYEFAAMAIMIVLIAFFGIMPDYATRFIEGYVSMFAGVF